VQKAAPEPVLLQTSCVHESPSSHEPMQVCPIFPQCALSMAVHAPVCGSRQPAQHAPWLQTPVLPLAVVQALVLLAWVQPLAPQVSVMQGLFELEQSAQ